MHIEYCINLVTHLNKLILQMLDQESQRLIEVQPSCEELIQEKLEDIIESWEELTKNADKRKARLMESLDYQKFLADLRDLVCKMIHAYLYSSV